MSVDGLGIGKLVVAIGVHILIGDAVVLAVVFPTVGSYVVHPNVVLVEGAVADLVLVRFLDDENARGDAVAAVATCHRVPDNVGALFVHDEEFVVKLNTFFLVATVEPNVAAVC